MEDKSCENCSGSYNFYDSFIPNCKDSTACHNNNMMYWKPRHKWKLEYEKERRKSLLYKIEKFVMRF